MIFNPFSICGTIRAAMKKEEKGTLDRSIENDPGSKILVDIVMGAVGSPSLSYSFINLEICLGWCPYVLFSLIFTVHLCRKHIVIWRSHGNSPDCNRRTAVHFSTSCS